MRLVHTILGWCALKGRYLLIAGLITALVFPGLTVALKPFIPHMMMAMLFFAAFRVGLKAAIGAAAEFRFSLLVILVFQIAVPVFLFFVFRLAGWQGVLPAAIVLMAAGAPISGAPNLSVLCGASPAPALRLLVIGTGLLPLTVIPVFWLLPELGSGADVLVPAGKLLFVIGISAALGFGCRRLFFSDAAVHVIRSADGASAIMMMSIVIGLMTAVGPAITHQPSAFAANLTAAFVANFGLQIAGFYLLGSERFGKMRVALSIVAGNRNIALFLTALPVAVTDPMLLFIGCYQIPMYLTPMLLGRLYRSAGENAQF